MTDKELLQQTFDLLKWIRGIAPSIVKQELLDEIRKRLAQPELMINGLTEEETDATMFVKGLK